MDETKPAIPRAPRMGPLSHSDITARTLKLLDDLTALIHEISDLNRRIRTLEQQREIRS